MSKIQIILNERLDRDKFDAVMPDPLYIEVVNNYFPEGSAASTIDANDLGSTYLEAVKKAVDQASFEFEENALVWVIAKTGKTFNLTESYLRDALSTAKPHTDLADSTPLKIRFEKPGFLANSFVEIDLWYNADFNPTDITLAGDFGIAITGDGSEFTIANDAECKISFRKPDGATEAYVIDFLLANEVIAP